MKYYPEDPDRERKVRNYLITLRNRRNNKGGSELYLCRGGPYDGLEIAISKGGDNVTATFSVSRWFGKYQRSGASLVWVNVS